MTDFGSFLRELRERAGIGLQTFADMVGIKPSNLSAIEHGRRKAPSDAEQLREMANALGLEEGAEKWNRFFDLARTSEALPADVQHMAQKSLIPALLRTIDNKQLTDGEIEQLIRDIQENKR